MFLKENSPINIQHSTRRDLSPFLQLCSGIPSHRVEACFGRLANPETGWKAMDLKASSKYQLHVSPEKVQNTLLGIHFLNTKPILTLITNFIQ